MVTYSNASFSLTGSYIYMSICLFGGDINTRARAEQGLDVLMPWGHQLIQSASSCSDFPATWSISDCRISVPGEPTTTTHLAPCLDGNLDSFWRSWAYAESIRRTYLIVALLVTIYSTLKTGWSGCPGGVTLRVTRVYGMPRQLTPGREL
jgi:hypothetical protein